MRSTAPLRNIAAAASLRQKLRIRLLLETCPVPSLPRETFLALCSKGTAMSPEDLMSREAASDFLNVLHEARVVIATEDTVFVRPEDVIQRLHTKLCIAPLETQPPAAKEAHEKLQRGIELQQKKGERALETVATWRKRFWSGVALCSGTQMATLSYLTFVQYDWDVMEPACYFVTMATSIVFYAYFLYFRREQSLSAVDENVLPVKIQSELAECSVDVSKLLADLETSEATKDATNTRCTERTLDEWLAQLKVGKV